MAPPTIDKAPVAARSTTRDQGTGQSRERARVTWQKELLARIDGYKRYPPERINQSAEILLTMRLDRTGRVVSAAIARSSGDGAFDHAALAMIERANPVPAPPPLIADEGLDFSLPVIFRKSGR
jgi:TonB family protein